jgi:hypothetical protein
MSNQGEGLAQADMAELLGEFVHQSEKLLALQFRLARRELADEIDKARGAATRFGAGAVLVALAGAYGTRAGLELLRRCTGLPWWACYGLAAGAAAGAGIGLLQAGGRKAASINPGLPRTRAALQENLSWVNEQVK